MKSTILITLFTKVVKTAAKKQQVCTLVYSVQSTTAQLNYNRFFSPFAWNLSEIYWSGMTLRAALKLLSAIIYINTV